jgi:hypothetical protein
LHKKFIGGLNPQFSEKGLARSKRLKFKAFFFSEKMRGSCDRMVVGFTTINAISAYHH